MRPGGLLHLYRIRLRSRLGTELLALAGIAVGVALVFAALVANASLTGAVRELGEEIAGRADFQLSARSASGFDQAVLRRVRRVRGARAAPVVEGRVNLEGPGGRRSVLLVGGDPRLGGRRGLFLPPPLADDLGLGAGGMVAVETGSGTARAPLTGMLAAERFGVLAESPVALASLPQARTLLDMHGRVNRIFVDAAAGHDDTVEAALRRIAADRLNLAPADREAELFEEASYPTSASTALFSALSALVGFLFAFNAVLLTVPQRRRLIADLRMAGYAPATVLQVVLLDAVLLGAAGAAVGLLLGGLASHLFFDTVPGYLTSAFAVGSSRIVAWQSVALAAGSGILAACLAVLVPLWGVFAAATARPARQEPTKRWLEAIGGFACLGLALAVVALAPALSLVGIGALLLALLLSLRVWLRLAAVAFGAVCRRLRSFVAILTALELRSGSARIRTLALAATGAVAVFATVSIGGARADLQRGLDRVATDLDSGAQVWVAFPGPTGIFGTTAIRVPPERLREIEALPEVRALSRNRAGFLDVGSSRVWVLASVPSRIGRVMRRQLSDHAPPNAIRHLRQGRWVTLSHGLASDLGVRVGDRVRLPLPVPTPLRVAAVTNNFGWPGGAIAMSAATYAHAWGADGVNTLGISLRRSARAGVAAAKVQAILGRGSALRAESAAARGRRQREASRAGLSRLTQIAAMVLISSVLAMAASMTGLVWQRRPSFAALQVQGLSRGELWRALLLEATLLLGAGCSFGALFGLLGQVLLDRALTTITGFPVLYEIAGTAAAGVLVAITTAAVAVLALPGWLAVSIPPGPGPAE